MSQQQRDVIDYLQEENRALRKQLGHGRLRFTDDQRRRLAANAMTLGRRVLRDIATIVTPDTLLAWHRRLIAQQYDGSARRGPGRPPVIFLSFAIVVVTTLGSNSALGPSQKLAMNFAMRWWVAAGVPVLVGVLPLKELAWNNERWYRFIRGLKFLLLWIAVGCIFCGGLQFMLAI